MFNLYDMLMEGTSAETISKNFTDELNAAIKKKKELEDTKNQKLKDANALADHINTFIKLYYPDTITVDNLTGESVMKSLDSFKSVDCAFKYFDSMPVENVLKTTIKDMGFSEFFKKHGIK